MSEVLSQSEIDALLQALNSGEVSFQDIKEESKEKKVKKYDFKNPQKVAKDQLRTLEIIHDNFARLLQTFLSGYLRTQVKLNILTVDQYAFSEFSNAISNPAFLSIIDFQPLNGQIVIDISTNIAFAMIDRLLGGDGERVGELRAFTEIETALLKKMVSRTLQLLAQAWENVIELNPVLDKIETNSQFAQVISPAETIALVTMNISIGAIEGMVNICIPHLVIEPILDKLSTKFWFSANKKELIKKDLVLVEKRLKNAPVSVKAQIGAAILTVNEILSLQVGDVIKLNKKLNDEVEILIGNSIKYLGIPGTSKNKIAVKITSKKKDGEELND